jgi:hypothetical protein
MPGPKLATSIRVDRDVHGTAALRCRAQFSQHQGLNFPQLIAHDAIRRKTGLLGLVPALINQAQDFGKRYRDRA